MSQPTRLLLTALLGPVTVTVLFGVLAFGTLYLLGERYAPLQITSGLAAFFACWQLTAVWWLWKQWH